MNWISVDEQLPELKPIDGTDSSISELVLVWAFEDDANEPGFLELASFSQGKWNGWLWSGDGTMEDEGFTVTHWAKIEPPKTSGPIAAK